MEEVSSRPFLVLITRTMANLRLPNFVFEGGSRQDIVVRGLDGALRMAEIRNSRVILAPFQLPMFSFAQMVIFPS